MKRDFQVDVLVYADNPQGCDVFTIDAVWMSPKVDPDGITLLLRWAKKDGALEEEALSHHHMRGVRPRLKEIGPQHYVLLGEAMSREWWENLPK